MYMLGTYTELVPAVATFLGTTFDQPCLAGGESLV